MTKTLTALLFLASSAFAQDSKLNWRPLDLKDEQGRPLERAFRTQIDVPADRSQPDGQKVHLAVARLEGKAGGVPLLYLHGGPGGVATTWVTHSMWEPFRELGDVFLLDQRGGGRSLPSLYLRPSAGVPEDALLSREAFGRYLAAASAEVAKSLRESGYEPSAFHNLENLADLEDVRAALGVTQWNVLGHSYGTHLGLLYLRHHPEAVANAVLIGVEGPDMTHKYPQAYDVHWRRLMLIAKSDPALAAHASELDDLLGRALARLEKEPLEVPADDPITRAPKKFRVGPYGLLLIMAFDIGDEVDIPVLPRLLHEVAKGETRTLAWFVRKRLQMVSGLPLPLITMDGGAGASAGRAVSIHEQSHRSPFAPILDLEFPAVNEVLKPRCFDDEYRAPITSTVRTLFISGALDANTPPYQAEEVRWGFTQAAHLVARHAGHDGCWLGNDKSLAAIRAFLGGEDVAHRDIDRSPLRFAPLEGKSSVQHPSLD